MPALDVPRPHKSTHAIFHFDDDSTLYYTDIRQFGRIHVVLTGEVPEFLGRRKLGVEPLTDDFQPAILENAASRRPRSKVKALLLDQRVVAGIGNIYADESLHRSGLHPAQQLAEVTSESLGRLRLAIIEVLRDAVENGVAEVVNGKAKPDARLPRVHGRQGEPCPRCGRRHPQSDSGRTGHLLVSRMPIERLTLAPTNEQALKYVRSSALLSVEEKAIILGGNAARMFNIAG